MNDIDCRTWFEDSSRLIDACGKAQEQNLRSIAAQVISCFDAGNKLLLCGNGGSASQAQHFAAEFVNKIFTYRQALAAVALTTDTSVLTSIGNDLSFDVLFARQVEALGRPGDMLLGLSTSGASANVIQACESAKKTGMKTVCFIGQEGSELSRVADICVPVPSTNTARIQEVHLCYGHCICELVEKHYL